MKKKIKDLTLKELKKFCEKHLCSDCPMNTEKVTLCYQSPSLYDEKKLEQEIEVEEDE